MDKKKIKKACEGVDYVIHLAGLDQGECERNPELALRVNGIGTIVSGAGEETKINSTYSIEQNYPNPFNSETNINFSIPSTEYVTLKIYNVQGKQVTTLFSKELKAGNYKASFDGNGLASGMYFYKISAGGFVETKKMIFLK